MLNQVKWAILLAALAIRQFITQLVEISIKEALKILANNTNSKHNIHMRVLQTNS